MNAKIIYLTPEGAKELLKNNIGNRKLKNAKDHYANQMKNGQWKENGEPIIVDVNGFVKDGQHRLHACIQANHSFYVPLISGVDSNVMDTIDTGTNRCLPDVLELNGFKYTNDMSAIIKTIIKHEKGLNGAHNGGHDRKHVTNSEGLMYAQNNADDLLKICRIAGRIGESNHQKVLTKKEIAWFLYAICSFDINNNHIEFIKGLCTGKLGSSSCTYYAYQKYLTAKINNTPLPSIYKFNLMARCWSIYKTDDTPVVRLNIKNDKLEVITK